MNQSSSPLLKASSRPSHFYQYGVVVRLPLVALRSQNREPKACSSVAGKERANTSWLSIGKQHLLGA